MEIEKAIAPIVSWIKNECGVVVEALDATGKGCHTYRKDTKIFIDPDHIREFSQSLHVPIAAVAEIAFLHELAHIAGDTSSERKAWEVALDLWNKYPGKQSSRVEFEAVKAWGLLMHVVNNAPVKVSKNKNKAKPFKNAVFAPQVPIALRARFGMNGLVQVVQ